jgi:hypothetical protein
MVCFLCILFPCCCCGDSGGVCREEQGRNDHASSYKTRLASWCT